MRADARFPDAPSAVTGAAARPAGRIGPNAVTRVAEAIGASPWAASLVDVFEAAGQRRILVEPPTTMVDEAAVAALHRAVRLGLGRRAFEEVMADAGRRTADYLLAQRIPRPLQPILRLLPAALAARVLLAAIGAHAWTFAGSGTFAWRVRRGATLTVAGGPLGRAHAAAHPTCHYYASTFEHLFRALVHPAARVTETACEAAGDDVCRFEVRWVR